MKHSTSDLDDRSDRELCTTTRAGWGDMTAPRPAPAPDTPGRGRGRALRGCALTATLAPRAARC
jgi:hypothetical protein